ncbi:CheR family methyltransferase [Dongshaea marina]|uniref:CheR family methyltransferase n=1 Tax=Dongshaea marina TaxID=2047966 RepID=UPI000D3E39E4|nr:CheR family methyltransferase [Dongshaea marina]
MIHQISDKEFHTISDFIHDEAGIILGENKKQLVINRLQKRLRFYELDNFSDYFKLVFNKKNKQEKQILVDHLTTNETSFFREPAHFDFLQHVLLNELNHSHPRVWSGACSSGEEVYSIAMLLAEKYPYSFWEVIGSDICQRVLEQAKRGCYLLSKMTPVETELLHKYFLKGFSSQEGRVLVGNDLKKHVSFSMINLTKPLPKLGVFDFIFLRNVLIYFSSQHKRLVIERVVGALKKGGYLFVGHSESLYGISDKLKMVKPSIFVRL